MPTQSVKCLYCGTVFVAYMCSSRQRKYCSASCAARDRVRKNSKWRDWACRQCGGTFRAYPRPGKPEPQFCSRDCYYAALKQGHFGRGAKSPQWRGGRSINTYGYVLVYDAERAVRGERAQVYEHRLVMEKYLGRRLRFPEETVHHKNGDKQDNRIENLELREGSHSRGAAATEVIPWAIEFLQRHGYVVVWGLEDKLVG